MGLRITHNHRRFQSAPPVKGAIGGGVGGGDYSHVSIRAPREGGDIVERVIVSRRTRFNPRPP